MIVLIILLSIAVILLSIRLVVLEERFKDLTKYLGVEQLFED